MTLQDPINIPKKTTNRLSVQVSLNGLSFLVANTQNNTSLFFTEKKLDHSTTPEELLMDIETVLFKNDILNQDFEEVALIYATPIYCLVPSPLFDETKASEYLKFNSKILAHDYMAHDTIENEDVVVVYVPFMNINNFFFEKYGSFSYYHATTILLKTILEEEKYSLPKMYLHFHRNTFDCIVLNKGGLQLCNSYTFKTPEDFLYYTLFCMEQLNLNPETLPVMLCGAISEEDDIYKMAYTYIKNLEFYKPRPHALVGLDQDLPHTNFILKNLQ